MIYTIENNYNKACQKNTLCLSCSALNGSIKGQLTKLKTGNWGIETKRKNGTLKHSIQAKENIRKGLKKLYENGDRSTWNNGLNAKNDNRVAKTGKSRPGKENPNYGKGYFYWWVKKYGIEKANEMNIECSRKKRAGFIKFLQNQHGQISPNYNSKSIPLIENKFKELGCVNYRHAETPDGEYHIQPLNYWVDGYDKDKNIVIEYYENRHKKTVGHDEQRKKNIIAYLDCEFIEIKEWEL